ncbi:MAG: competence/damage-inducible protein A [Candidatus Baldrarchaeia archaeon]
MNGEHEVVEGVGMITVGILVIGNEILDGVIQDTNSNWLAKKLKEMGFLVKEIMVVRDNVNDIAKALKRLIDDGCEIVITSGGLGPTHDDKTLEGVAHAFNLKLVLNEEALEIVKRQYQLFYQLGIVDTPEITPPRKKMAMLPEGAKALDNRVGGAPGVLLELPNAMIICLPGVPRELKWIFDNQVSEIIKSRIKGVMYEEIAEMPIIDESKLSPLIDEVMRKIEGVYIKSMPGAFRDTIRIKVWVSARGSNLEEAKIKVKRAIKMLKEMCSKV